MPFEGRFQDSPPFIDVLGQQFHQDAYTDIIFMSAWTRIWPLEQIMEPLRQHLNSGGRFTLYTGNSFRSTSIEAMECILSLASDFPGQVHVFVCAQNTGSFHPKVYLFLNSDERRSWLSVGSSNLTRGGMNTNIEANLTSTDWEKTVAVVQWWQQRPDSVNQLRLTPHLIGTEEEPGPLREMFNTEEEISNQATQSGETTAHDLQLIQNNAAEIVCLGAEVQADEADEPQELAHHPRIEALFIKRIRTVQATSHAGGYMDLSLPIVRDRFFGNYPLPDPDTGSHCTGRVNLNLFVNGTLTEARIEEWDTGEGARFMLDGYNQARFNDELPQFSYKLFVRTTSAYGGQIYVFFINIEHHAHQRIVHLFESHQEIYDGPLPRGRRYNGLNMVYLRGDTAAITTLIDQLSLGLCEDFNEVLRQAMQADPNLQDLL